MIDLSKLALRKGKKALVTGKLITGETLYVDGGYHIID